MARQRPHTALFPILLFPILLFPILLFVSLTTFPTPSIACEQHNHPQIPTFNAATYTANQSTPESDDDATLPVAIIAAIVIGAVALVVAIVLLTFFLARRCSGATVPVDDPYRSFADWRKDRNLTSVEIDRHAREKAARQRPPDLHITDTDAPPRRDAV